MIRLLVTTYQSGTVHPITKPIAINPAHVITLEPGGPRDECSYVTMIGDDNTYLINMQFSELCTRLVSDKG